MSESKPSLDAIRQEVTRASQHYYYTPLQLGIDRSIKRFIIERCLPFINGPYVLDLGYVDGDWTEAARQKNCHVDIVEGAQRHVEEAQKAYSSQPEVRIFHQLFQEFKPDRIYNTIIAGDMIRYLEDPEGFLNGLQSCLADDGRLIVTVPNSRSLHRRIGSLMNLEATPTQSNQRDKEVGNQRSYDRYEFRNLLLSSGYEIEALHGCFLKPLSSQQMSEWDEKMLRAFLLMGDELEDYGWFLYASAQKRQAAK
jgi:trans-aconitate methyltransferase